MATVLAPSRADRAFERLYRRYVADVYRYVLAVLQNEADAEDAAQTAFLHAYRAYERGERAEKPLNWLIAIAHNVCRQRFRESARRPRLVELEEDSFAARETDDEAPRAEEIRRALGFLAFNQRAALVMRELQGRSYDEIGRILGVSNSAVETLLFRARRAMREQLEGGLTCGEAELALSKRADGELAFAERGRLRAHLRECAECASLERGLRFRRRAIRGIGLVPLPGSLGSFFGGGGAAVGTGGAAAVGGGLGVGAKAAAVVVAGVLGSGLAGDATKVRASKIDEPAARAAARTAQVQQSPQPASVVQSGAARTERAKPARRRSALARARRAPAPAATTTAAAAPAAAATGASLSSPVDETQAPAANSPSPAAPVQTPTTPAVPSTPAPPVNTGNLPLPAVPSLGISPPPPPPAAPPAPLPTLPQPNLPPAPPLAEVPKVTVTITIPGVKPPEVPPVQVPPVPPVTKP
jgi:RNA polymerase sigma factor (sigma-70 family)